MAAINLYGDLWGTMAAGEGTGKNPISSAEGFGQVLDDTYADWVKRYRAKYPWMPATKQEYVNSPMALQKRVYDEVIGPNEYGPSLTKGGFDVTPENLAMTNWLGPTGGVNFLKGATADPNQPGHALASESAVRNNQGVFFDKTGRARTAGEVIDWWKSKGQQAPSVPIPGANLEASPPPPPTSPAPAAPPAERSGTPPMNELPTPWQALAGAWNAYIPNVPDWLKRLDDRVVDGLGQYGAVPPGVPLSPAAQQAIAAKKIYAQPASPPMAHQAPLPEVQVGERTVTPGSEPVAGAPQSPAQAPAVNPAAAVEAAQAVQNYQSPAQEEYTPWTMENMLRFAAGMAGGETFGQGLSQGLRGFTEGMAQDRKMALERQKVAAMVAGEAQKLIELGMNPAVAMDIAGGRLKGPEATKALQAIGMQGGLSGKRQAGEIYTGPDGTPYRETFNPRGGVSSFTNMTTGEVTGTLPKGSMHRVDSMYRQLNKNDADVYSKANENYGKSQAMISDLATLKGLVNSGALPAGSDIFTRVRQGAATALGMPEAAAIQIAQNISGQIKQIMMGNYKGLGPMSDRDLQALHETLPNINTDPRALNWIIDRMSRYTRWNMAAHDAFEAQDQEKPLGYGKFIAQWQKANPFDKFGLDAPVSTPAAQAQRDWKRYIQ